MEIFASFFFVCLEALVCDCGLQWLSMWLREHSYSDTEVYCGFPHWLQGMSLIQLHHKNFTCG